MTLAFKGSAIVPVPSGTRDVWTCFQLRATSLGGNEIGHLEMCTDGSPARPFASSLWVAKLIVEGVGTLSVGFHMEGMLNDQATAPAYWYKYATLLPSTEGSILPHLSTGEYKRWSGYCYVAADIKLLTSGGNPVLFDLPKVFFECAYRKPEHQRKHGGDGGIDVSGLRITNLERTIEQLKQKNQQLTERIAELEAGQ